MRPLTSLPNSAWRVVIGGKHRLMRHPMMLGFLIAFWATPDMSAGHLLFAIMTSGCILFAVKALEERDLVNEFGDRYRDYQRKVPMMLPLPGRAGDAAGNDASVSP